MLMSGFAGIAYEILYGRLLANLIGDQFAVSAAILIAFLTGSGVGAAWAHRLWSRLWLIEVGIGLCALALVSGAAPLDALLLGAPEAFGRSLEGAIAIGVVLLLGPAFLIGCAVPLFAGYLGRLRDGAVFSTAYGLYNLGAAMTALAAEFALIRWFGIKGAILGVASVNIAAGLLLYLRFGAIAVDPPGRPAEDTVFGKPALAALILASAASAAFQMFMIKLSELLLGPYRESFALVLFWVFLGIALGAAMVGRWRIAFDRVLLLSVAGLVLTLMALEPALALYATLHGIASLYVWSSVALKAGLIAVLMAIPAISFGAVIPALLGTVGHVARASGRLLLISSLANVGGFLLMTFVFHRYLDYGLQLLSLVALAAVAMIVACPWRRMAMVPASGLMAMAVAFWLFHWDENLLYVGYTEFRSPVDMAEAREDLGVVDGYRGYQDVFAITWNGRDPYFFINGYVSMRLNNPSEKVVGALGTLFAPRTDRALVLGLGSGATASTVGRFFDRTTVVEINQVVRENLHRMAHWNYGIDDNARMSVVVDDGIHFIKTDRQTYSLILNTVTTPLYFSSSKLYTLNFFELVKRRLAPDGIYATWFDIRAGDAGIDIILATLDRVFEHCAMVYVKSGYHLLICSSRPVRVTRPDMIAENDLIAKDLRGRGVEPSWLPYRLILPEVLELAPDAGPINTADGPVLEFAMARLNHDGIPRFEKAYLEAMNPDRVRRALGLDDFDPMILAVNSRLDLGSRYISNNWRYLVVGEEPSKELRFEAMLLAARGRLASEGDTADAHVDYGEALLDAGRPKDAVTAFLMALTLKTDSPRLHRRLADVYAEIGMATLARRYYRRAMQLASGRGAYGTAPSGTPP